MTDYYRTAHEEVQTAENVRRIATHQAIVVDRRLYLGATAVNVLPAIVLLLRADLTAAGVSLLLTAIATALSYYAVTKVTVIDTA
jgi:hypothetical protein